MQIYEFKKLICHLHRFSLCSSSSSTIVVNSGIAAFLVSIVGSLSVF